MQASQPQAPAAPPPPTTADIREEIRQQIQQTQARIREEVARATADPDAPTAVTAVPAPIVIDDIPPRAADVALAFFAAMVMIVVFFPMARAMARRIDRRSDAPRLPADVSAQLAQLNQAVDAIAVEVERISEGQRFTTKLLNDLQSARGSIAAPRNEP